MKKKLMLNTVMSLLLQVITVVCGFVLPRLLLETYGSEVNGLTQSINQFLYIVTFLELGVGQVLQSALYKPLATGDILQVSKALRSGSKYFRTIACAIAGYVVLLCILAPYVFPGDYDRAYTAGLIAAMGIGSFAQYYFGLVDKILLNADQKGYIQMALQIFCNLLNVTVLAWLIRSGSSIHTVKLVSAGIFLLSPVVIRFYIRKHYPIHRKVTYEEEPIPQKWNGVAQHISTVVLEGTDIIVLTLFSTLSNVSVYSVYYLVISGVRQLYTSATAGVQAMVGALWAKEDKSQLEDTFQKIETVLHLVVVLLYGCVAVLLVPFVRVYTQGITDAEYIQPTFALILTLAYAIRCLRTPYNILILAGGRYRQTQSCHIVSAVLNILVSVAAVWLWGLVGIAIGTFIAYAYQTVWMMVYNSRHLLRWSLKKVGKQLAVDALLAVSIYGAACRLPLPSVTYFGWFILAAEVFVIALVITVAVGMLFYRRQLMGLMRK